MDLLSKHENFENEGTITVFISEAFKESTASQVCFMSQACAAQSIINMSNGTKMYR